MTVEVYQRLAAEAVGKVDDQLVLDHIQREKGRFKTLTLSGMEIRVFLPRGHTLNIGEVLRSRCGKNLCVIGALESVVIARAENWVAAMKSLADDRKIDADLRLTIVNGIAHDPVALTPAAQDLLLAR